MLEITLDDREIGEIRGLLADVAANFTSVDSQEFLMEATLLAQALPRRLRKGMNEFRLRDNDYGVAVIRGFPVDAEKIGPTPASWDERPAASRTLEEEALLSLCGTLLGDLVTWASEQDGYIVHNVLPIKQYEDSQLGWGSANEFILHVEDAFSPYSPDYLGLICMRNPDLTGTTISALSDLDTSHLDLDTLFGENFFVRPDDAHLASATQQNSYNTHRDLALSQREEEIKQPPRTAILFGDREAPYLRLDPPYMYADEGEQSQAAMRGFLQALNENKTRVCLRPGDMVFIDNFRTVHGRDPFKAKYDGTDRWLKRVKVARDLRKSRAHRASATSRKIL
ncbi:guanitoxin biosynthesis L-enduracididine beta-hydroxylase GntD [Burkholderia alba]|uniref:guanitoxin biosynthesis L-enduracididine beta-hydroxylase GntD n=1 Tax=Burkholderia alba TaxID=2683677 RepID=UPI002B052134|nr:guanitoxin biosynthesis L-enduracididine beta-hydroxylase GntD [Burkholderia alba]